MADKLKFSLALLLLIAGISGFYYLGEQPMIVQVFSVLSGVGAGIAVAWFTSPGQRFANFSREAVVETKKVVWPTRGETIQVTGVVFSFVLVMAVVLWVTDKSLEWVLYDLILGWKK
jgi:preprotein translocase subunit SecE